MSEWLLCFPYYVEYALFTPKQLGRFWLSLVLVVSRNNAEQIFILVCIAALTS
jgi:hypothetical protein